MRSLLLSLLFLARVVAAPYAVYNGNLNQAPANPTAQGWVISGASHHGVEDGGTLAWELFDDNNDVHPTMSFDYGAAHVPVAGDPWSFTVQARLIAGNGVQTNVIQWSNGTQRYLFFPYVNANGKINVHYFGADGKIANLNDFVVDDGAYHAWAIEHDGAATIVTYDGAKVVDLGAISAGSAGRGVHVGGGTSAGIGAIRVASATFDATLANPPATVSLARVFADHMVLQRNEPVTIYGMDSVDLGTQTIEVEFAGQTKTTTSEADGSWQVVLDPMEASIVGRDLVVRGSATIALHDVLVGEVWLAAGQSNMNATVERSAAVNPPHPETFSLIRMCNWEGSVDTGAGTVYRAGQFANLTAENFYIGSWEVMDANTVRAQSAAAYHFAHEVVQALGVPIGIVDISIGGTSTEAFMSPASLQAEPHLQQALAQPHLVRTLGQWTSSRLLKNVYNNNPNGGNYVHGDPTQPHPHPYAPGFLYATAMPHLGQFTFKGVIWYQGESNAEFTTGAYQINGNQLSDYQTMVMSTLVEDWRRTFGKPELPFYMVQLPRINAPNRILWPFYREAQARVAASLEGCELATIMEFGEDGDVHPRQKAPVGQRLAAIARVKLYGENITYQGPIYRDYEVRGNQIVIHFDHAGGGLIDSDGGALRNFMIAGADRVFVPATATLVGDTIEVSAAAVAKPVAARHAWSMNAAVDLMNAEGFSASSFRTDRWIATPGRKLRVACIGDSITRCDSAGDESLTYPAQLAARLGTRHFEVRNFGRNGAGIIRSTNRYQGSSEHQAAIAWQPDVVICNLGINDITTFGSFTKAQFQTAYLELIDAFIQSGSVPLIIQWSPLAPIFPGQTFYGDPNLVTLNQWVRDAAACTNTRLVDLSTPLADHPEWFPDHLHPNADGANRIGEVIFDLIEAMGDLSTPVDETDGAVSSAVLEIDWVGGELIVSASQLPTDGDELNVLQASETLDRGSWRNLASVRGESWAEWSIPITAQRQFFRLGAGL